MSTTRRAKELLSVASINIAGASVKYSDQLKLLGVTLDAAFTFDALERQQGVLLSHPGPMTHSTIAN